MSSNKALENEIEKVIADIKSLEKIQGNTNIAKSTAKTLLQYITHAKPDDLDSFIISIKKHGYNLSHARPNEPLAVNAVALITKDLEKYENQQQVRIKAIERIEQFFKYVDESYEIIRLNAVNLLRGHSIFFNHCHSSLARDILIRIHELNPEMYVINDETRPLLQGRTTATKLADAGVKVLHTLDSAVASVFLDSRYPKPEIALVGCDGFSINGDIINKVGTLNIALAAKEANVPFYVVSQFMKVDMRTSSPDFEIEQRSKDEVWKERPKNVDVLNPAFDLVPGKYITGGLITEKGLIKPDEIRDFLK
jgi:ribose 1,5-bisphosphate isomerase